jgi:FkbM family methyltransferase
MVILKKLVSKLRRARFFRQKTRLICFEGQLLAIPSRHSLIKLQNQEPFRHQSLRLAAKYFIQDQRNHVIDVGANIGDTAIIINSGSLINAFYTLVEPSSFFLKYLHQNSQLIDDCEIIEKFISPKFPITEMSADLQYWGGTALLIESPNKKIPESEQILLHQLERANTGFIKIDCDGKDSDILLNYLKFTRCRPAIYFENTIASFNDLLKSIEVIKLALSMNYGFASISSNDGLLIWSGAIDISSLKDIFQFQLNLVNLKLSSRLSYTDILLVQKTDFKLFAEFQAELRILQENHFASSTTSG